MHPFQPKPVQLDLFGPTDEERDLDAPRWAGLPDGTQQRATALLARMLLDHQPGEADAEPGEAGGRGDV